MKKRLWMGSALALLVSATSMAVASPDGAATPAPPEAGGLVAQWNQLLDALRQLGPETIEKLPPRLRNDPQVQAEALRLLIAATSRAALVAVAGDPDHPQWIPWVGPWFDLTQPNADTVYKNADITPGGVYRLRGRRGTVPFMVMGEFAPADALKGAIGYHDFDALKLDKEGRFDVVISSQRPEGYVGDWWKLDPRTSRFVLRQIAYDWANEKDPSISIERLDKAPQRPRPSADSLARRYAAIPAAVSYGATAFLGHVEKLRQEGYINKLKVFDVSQIGGLAGQSYYEGAYELSSNEALIVEAQVPDKCRYWSLILTNDVYETTDWVNNQSSLNGSQARVDPDGKFRIVVSARDPGVPNWLDTAGYPTGVVQGRWMGCEGTSIPAMRKVRLADVGKILPPGTPHIIPEQREKALRDRRSAVQQRPLW